MASDLGDLVSIFEKAKHNEVYLQKLFVYGREKGFDSFLNRKKIWPFLLGIELGELSDSGAFQWKQQLDRSSEDFQQLQKDAERSLSSMKTFENITKFHLRKKQEAVLTVLDHFFAKNTDLKYIQGFHDVASIFLIVYGNNTGYYMMETAGKVYFHDFLKFDVGTIGVTISSLVFELIVKKDKDFETIFACYKESKFLIFILPWILTWFAHVFSSVKTISRIWDFLLCTGPHGVIYLAAGIILQSKRDLLNACEEFDQASIQTFYQEQARHERVAIQPSIKIAVELESEVEISKLSAYKDFNAKSIFRLQNFYSKLSIHKKFHQQWRDSIKLKKNLKRLLKVGAITLTVVSAVVLWKYGAKYMPKGEL